MAEERDAKVAAAYRDLGAEEPPRALDEAILAAARHARPGDRRPGPSWTRRWAVPLSLAAVLALSITVTLRIQHEAPESMQIAAQQKEAVARAPAAPEQAPLKLKAEMQIKSAAPSAQPAPAVASRSARERALEEPKPFADLRQDRIASASPSIPAAPAAAPPSLENRAARGELGSSAESSVAGAMARRSEDRTARDAEAATRAPQVGPLQALSKSMAQSASDAPERELERIAELRRQEKHDEADKALAEFRKRYPDFKIPESMRERVERR